jgi:hypothetical protein
MCDLSNIGLIINLERGTLLQPFVIKIGHVVFDDYLI